MSLFVPCATAEPARWIHEHLGKLGHGVTSVVPRGFPAYVRILHPFEGPGGANVTWTELARHLGREPHRLMQLGYQAGSIENLQGLYEYPPDPGDLPADIAQILAQLLAPHTSTPQECFFAIWDGWNARPSQGLGASFRIPGRHLHLYTAPLSTAAERFTTEGSTFTHSPNIWWPADQAWCVATEIDLTCTYVGCSNDAAHQLVDSQLEAFPVEPDDPITIDTEPPSP